MKNSLIRAVATIGILVSSTAGLLGVSNWVHRSFFPSDLQKVEGVVMSFSCSEPAGHAAELILASADSEVSLTSWGTNCHKFASAKSAIGEQVVVWTYRGSIERIELDSAVLFQEDPEGEATASLIGAAFWFTIAAVFLYLYRFGPASTEGARREREDAMGSE